MSKKVIVKTKSINSKSLFESINSTIYDAITTLGVRWTSDSNRKAFIEVIEDFLDDLEANGIVMQHKVICDHRNNKSFSTDAKKYVLEVFYKQPHCLNTSKIIYEIINKE